MKEAQAAGDGQRPACGSKTKGDYNTPLHVFALVLILVLSVGGKKNDIGAGANQMAWQCGGVLSGVVGISTPAAATLCSAA